MRRALSLCFSMLLVLVLVSSALAGSRFVDNGDQTVTDTLTGLMWTKSANLAGMPLSWYGAFDYVSSLNGANLGAGTFGHNDWRDPTVDELMTLVDTTRSFPALPAGHPFTNVQSDEYWSSTSPGDSLYAYAYGVNIGVGTIYSGHKPNDGYLWPVRNVGSPSSASLSVTPASADFGTVAVGGAAAANFTLGNGGAANLAVSGISLSGSNGALFTVAAGSCGTLTPTIAPGGSCTVSVTFRPTSAGSKSATLRIASNDPLAATRDLPLTGAGADTVAPVVTRFSVPSTSTTLAVPITSFIATDNVGVTGYCVSEGETPAGCSWSSSALSQYSFASATPALRTLHPFARDAAGNVAAGPAATLTLDIDHTPPLLAVSALASGSATAGSTLNVAGSVSDASGVSQLTVAGFPVSVGADGSFTFPVQLQGGSASISTVATDAVGNRSTDSRTITVDPSLPSLSIASPADNSTSNKGFVTVSGQTATGISSVAVALNGAAAGYAALNGAAFSATVNLSAGINTIQVTATDLSGKGSAQKRTVLYDPQKPTINILTPVQDLETTTAAQTVAGTIADAVPPVTVKVSDGTSTFTPVVNNGAFSQSVTLSTAKRYAITVTVTEGNGNQTTLQRNIIFKKADPGTRFSDNGDQTVTDNLTGLTWTRNANLPNTDMSWQEGLDFVAALNSANGGAGSFGHNDWRLPKVEELESLVDTTRSNPALPAGHPFLGIEPYEYWSATVVPNNYAYVFTVDLYSGSRYSSHDYNFGFVWPVRGEQSFATATPLPVGITGSSYSESLVAGWGSAPYTWSIASGTLPPGIELDAVTGSLTGSAARAGVYSFTLRIADATSATELRPLALTVTDVACDSAAVRIAGGTTRYADIADAYAHAADADVIQLQALDFSSDLLFNRDIRVTLQGGFDCGYSANTAVAAIVGTLRLSSGSVKVEKLSFR